MTLYNCDDNNDVFSICHHLQDIHNHIIAWLSCSLESAKVNCIHVAPTAYTWMTRVIMAICVLSINIYEIFTLKCSWPRPLALAKFKCKYSNHWQWRAQTFFWHFDLQLSRGDVERTLLLLSNRKSILILWQYQYSLYVSHLRDSRKS